MSLVCRPRNEGSAELDPTANNENLKGKPQSVFKLKLDIAIATRGNSLPRSR